MHKTISLTCAGWFIVFSVSGIAQADVGQSSFTPAAFLIPIRRILIADQLGKPSLLNSTLYECKASQLDDCLVDVIDNNALARLASGTVKMSPGQYNGVSISNCNDNEGGYTAYVKGSVVLSGTTYFTTANGQVLSTQASDLGFVPLRFTGCQYDILFPSPLVLAEKQVAKLNLFLSAKDLSWASLGPAAIPEGCTGNLGGTASVCAALALVTAPLGEVSPQLRTFHIYQVAGHPETAGGQILVLMDSQGNVLGGYTRRLFSETSLGMSGNFDTACKTWNNNGDGSYSFENIGSTFDDYYMRYDAFRLEDHTATYLTRNGTTVTYWAVKQ